MRRLPPLALACALLGPACDTQLPDVNLLTLEEDMELGVQLHEEILSDPDTYPIVSEEDHPEAYAHLYRMRDEILSTGEVQYADEFDWPIFLIHDDATLNAFAAPGGYIYVYTGLMRYLDHEDHFAGVLGHEIAHADQRHSTQQLTKIYGVQTILGLVFGEDPGLLPEIAAGLVSLQFSRTDESEADSYSVEYLCPTDWASDGAAGFFEKLLSEGGVEIPAFLSTHPSSDTRVEDIRAYAGDLGCPTDLDPDADWAAVLATLPPEQTE